MSEQEQLKPQSENKSLTEWTDQEIEKFGDAFSLEDFELVRPDERDKGHVKVRLPESVEPMAKGLITAGREMVEAFDAPLARKSQETMKQFIGNTANAVNATEAQEAEWIQKFGEFTEVAGMMAGRPDPALQDLQSDTRLKTHQMIAVCFRKYPTLTSF